MSKKITSGMLVVLMIISYVSVTIVGLPAVSAAVMTSGDFQYEIMEEGTEVAITRYTGSDSTLVIPGDIDGISVTTIFDNAFVGHLSQTISVSIPANITSIGATPFLQAVNLTSITVDPDNPSYASIDGVLYDKNITTLIEYPAGNANGSVTIPSSVTRIEFSAFAYSAKLTSVTIPESVTSIGAAAFAECTSLSSVTISNSVTVIDDFTFQYCSALTSVTIPENTTSIGAWAFYGCSSITNIVIPASMTIIYFHAFEKCSILNEIIFEGDAPAVGDSWVLDCGNDLMIYYYPMATGFTTSPWSELNCSEFTSTSPMVSITSPAEKSYFKTRSVTVTWAINDPNSNLTKVEFRYDRGVWTEESDTSKVLSSLSDGTHIVQVRITYTIGVTVTTTSTMVSLRFVVDTEAPTAIVMPSGDDVSIDSEIVVVFSEKMNVTATSIDIENFDVLPVWSGSIATFTPASLSYNREYVITITGIDLAGNTMNQLSTFNTTKVGHIEGYLVDKNGTALISASVILSNGMTVTTGATGHFEFKNLTLGTYTVTIHKDGYKWENVSAAVEANKTTGLGQLRLSSISEDDPGSDIILPITVIVALAIIANIGLLYLDRRWKK
ncbi:MAG: leucine-rich repeat protein [Methanomassiliicoccales archaeon]|nr:leucine-rich repeat protein [Methanomassiliicoccales archaeon]